MSTVGFFYKSVLMAVSDNLIKIVSSVLVKFLLRILLKIQDVQIFAKTRDRKEGKGERRGKNKKKRKQRERKERMEESESEYMTNDKKDLFEKLDSLFNNTKNRTILLTRLFHFLDENGTNIYLKLAAIEKSSYGCNTLYI